MRFGGAMTQRIGYAAGAFDVFHIGHLQILRRAREHCDILIAGVVSDEMLLRTKGISPFIPTDERAEIVRHIDFVDDVHIERVPDKLDAWRRRVRVASRAPRRRPLLLAPQRTNDGIDVR